MRRGLPCLLCVLCGLTVTAPVAAAQDDEVFVDPHSPSGKEYQLPIDRARQQGATKRQRQRSAEGTRSAPLFGEGVEGGGGGTTAQPPRGSSAEQPAKDAAQKARSDRKAREVAGRRGESAAREKAAADARAAELARTKAIRTQAASPGGGGATLAIIGAGLAVLLAGAAIGIWLRRRAAS